MQPPRDDKARMNTRRRIATVLVGAGIAAAAVIAALTHDGPPDITATRPSSGDGRSEAARVLEAAADVARRAPIATDGEYEFTRMISGGRIPTGILDHGENRSFNTFKETTYDLWIGPDGSGRLRRAERYFRPTRRDRARAREVGLPLGEPRPSVDRDYPAPRIVPIQQRNRPLRLLEEPLPSDPDALVGLLSEAASEGGVPAFRVESRQFDFAAQVLLGPTSSNDLRAAAFDLLASIDGVEFDPSAQYFPRAQGFRGGAGTAVWIDLATGNERDPHLRRVIVFDPDTADVLSSGTEFIGAFADNFGRFPYQGYAVIEQHAIVDSTDRRPSPKRFSSPVGGGNQGDRPGKAASIPPQHR